jgi:hypothetical protein
VEHHGLVEVAQRRKGQAPPPWVIWETLNEPFRVPERQWLDLTDDERPPVVVFGAEPHELTWSSIWPARPDLRIHFTIEPDGAGSMLRWALLAPVGLLDQHEIGTYRHRLNFLINGALRGFFDR